MILGAVLILSALLLYLYNYNEEKRAGKLSAEHLEKVVSLIEDAVQDTDIDLPGPADNPFDPRMPVAYSEGSSYIGYIYIPCLEGLKLPIMSSWNYDLLKVSPCLYNGSFKTDDLVLMGHNYVYHFGKLSRLNPGDEVYFTDMEGGKHRYRVVATDVLGSGSVEDMTAGEYDLTMFTCDYSGANRITVRCDRVKN